MTITKQDGRLLVNGKVLITEVPDNVAVYPAPSGSAFIGASSPTTSSYHVFTLGILKGFNIVTLYRYKIWWIIPRFGTSASDVLPETEMLLLEVKEETGLPDEASEKISYILIIPCLEGSFRASLQGNSENELQFCVESGDPSVQINQVSESVFVNSGEDPYELIKISIKILAAYKGTFRHVDDKKLPAHLDWFGWCTWDAFYRTVTPDDIERGLESFSQGGCVPRWLIIDEGWQETYNQFIDGDDHRDEPNPEFATRLKDIKENDKFGHPNSDKYTTMSEFITFIKERFGLKYVYVWQALLGNWGGVWPSSEAMKKYNPKLVYPVFSPGNLANFQDIAMVGLARNGIGVIDPQKVSEFYNDYHCYLASLGFDGVKVDIQNAAELVGSGYGGRVNITAAYQKALEEAVARHFKNNNLISSMSHNTDSIFSSQRSASIRASDDFMPPSKTTQTVHVASVSFSSLLLGEVSLPDWDMFQSKHETALFHASARAIGGCPVYVSDKPGNQDFELLKKLVLPDGSILRARFTGRPTRDCLFKDSIMDGKSLLKIWNLNKLSGFLGVFNCQGAGDWPFMPNSRVISGEVSPKDVEYLEEVAGDKWRGDCAVYAYNSGCLTKVPKTGIVEVSLGTLTSELYTVSPIRVFDEVVQFAPIGLLDMLNSGGALESLSSALGLDSCIIKIRGHGCGRFGAYSSTEPRGCTVDTKKKEFRYSPEDGLLSIQLDWECQPKDIEFIY